MVFGKRLKETRESKNILQKQLASDLGISVASISQYEKSHREPDFKTLFKICTLLDVSADYLLGLSDIPARVNVKKPLSDKISPISSIADTALKRDSLAEFDQELHEEILSYARFRQAEFDKNSSKDADAM